MIKKDNETNTLPSTNNTQDVKVNNNFSLTINFGDSLNLLALIAGVYLIRKITKRNKANRLVKEK